MKSWIVSILLGFYFLSLSGPVGAFSPRVGFTLEINHKHSHGDRDHSHDRQSSHSHHTSSEQGKKKTEESHCHKICVAACAPVWFTQNVFTLIPLEASTGIFQERPEIILSNASGSIFRPPIFV